MSPLQESLSKDIVFYMCVKGHLVNIRAGLINVTFPLSMQYLNGSLSKCVYSYMLPYVSNINKITIWELVSL